MGLLQVPPRPRFFFGPLSVSMTAQGCSDHRHKPALLANDGPAYFRGRSWSLTVPVTHPRCAPSSKADTNTRPVSAGETRPQKESLRQTRSSQGPDQWLTPGTAMPRSSMLSEACPLPSDDPAPRTPPPLVPTTHLPSRGVSSSSLAGMVGGCGPFATRASAAGL